VVATRGALPDDATLPLPYSPSLLDVPAQDAAWVAVRLRSYANLEKLKLLLQHRGPSAELTATLVRALAFPAFAGHLVDSCAFFVEKLLGQGKLDDALLVTLAVAQGPHPPELRQEFRGFAERLGAPPDALAATG
jgi:hypothetical protein